MSQVDQGLVDAAILQVGEGKERCVSARQIECVFDVAIGLFYSCRDEDLVAGWILWAPLTE